MDNFSVAIGALIGGLASWFCTRLHAVLTAKGEIGKIVYIAKLDAYKHILAVMSETLLNSGSVKYGNLSVSEFHRKCERDYFVVMGNMAVISKDVLVEVVKFNLKAVKAETPDAIMAVCTSGSIGVISDLIRTEVGAERVSAEIEKLIGRKF